MWVCWSALSTLFIISIGSVGADTTKCPDDFQLLNDKKCVKVFTRNAKHFGATSTCDGYGGQLVSIRNAIDNNAITDLLPASGSAVWIGLKCNAYNNPNACLWDDRSGNAAYNNFMKGFPSINVGACIYMLNSGDNKGKWISGACNLVDINYICEVPPISPKVENCAFQFDGNCYFPTLIELTEPEARYACQKECGDLVSIHSAEENAFVKSLFSDNVPTYIRNGGQMDSSGAFSWSDNTPFDYNNVGFSKANLGNCMSMTLKDDIIQKGKWINSVCQTKLPFVCKRAHGVQCDFTIPPTSAPDQCSGLNFLDYAGTMHSSNWPNNYMDVEGTTCSFVLNTPIDTVVQAQFETLDLDPIATLSLYNQIEDTVPAVTFDANSAGSNMWFNSTTNTMKVIFRPCMSNCDQFTDPYRWQGTFRPSGGSKSTPAPYVEVTPNPLNPSGCNDTILSAPGAITSPNYPNLYSNFVRCSYHLSVPGGYRINFQFEDISTEECCDIIVARDGPFVTSPVIGRASGVPVPSSVSFKSTTNSMFVTFNTDAWGQGRGFKAHFQAF